MNKFQPIIKKIPHVVVSTSIVLSAALVGPGGAQAADAQLVQAVVQTMPTQAASPVVKKFKVVCHNEHPDIRWSGVTISLVASSADARLMDVHLDGTLQAQGGAGMNGHEQLVVYLISHGIDAAKAVIMTVPPGAANHDVREVVQVESRYFSF